MSEALSTVSRRILYVDGDAAARNTFTRLAGGESRDIDLAEDLAAACSRCDERAYALIFVDEALRRTAGVKAVDKLRGLRPDATFVLVCSERVFATASEAINSGGFRFLLTKPMDGDALRAILAGGTESFRRRVVPGRLAEVLARLVTTANSQVALTSRIVEMAAAWTAIAARGGEPQAGDLVNAARLLRGQFTGGAEQLAEILRELLASVDAAEGMPHTTPRAHPAAVPLAGKRSRTAKPSRSAKPGKPRPSSVATGAKPRPTSFGSAGKPRPTSGNVIQPRVPVVVEVFMRDDETLWSGVSENISAGGVFVRTARLREIGDVIRVELSLPHGDVVIRTDCEVTWVRPTRGRKPEEQGGMGLRFLAIEPPAETAISEMVASWADDIFQQIDSFGV